MQCAAMLAAGCYTWHSIGTYQLSHFTAAQLAFLDTAVCDAVTCSCNPCLSADLCSWLLCMQIALLPYH